MQTLREKIENIRFILLDMDGTMFNAAHRIDAETADVMRQLMDKGYYVAAATGRGLATLQPYPHPWAAPPSWCAPWRSRGYRDAPQENQKWRRAGHRFRAR